MALRVYEAVLALAILAGLVGCSGSSSGGPGGGQSCPNIGSVGQGTILFQSDNAPDCSDNPGPEAIWLANVSGSAAPLQVLPGGIHLAGTAVWSPDAHRIAFASGGETVNISVMNADGSNLTNLTNLTAIQANSFNPAWSPDGTRIAFTSLRALDGSNAVGQSNIWIMNADGSGATPLTRLTVETLIDLAVWSPDGTTIAYSSQRALDGSNASLVASNIWVVKPDGSGATPLTKLTQSFAKDPQWSPSGAMITFDSDGPLDGSDGPLKGTNIWVMKADGSGAMPLTKLTANNNVGFPQWSPDGTRIAYYSSAALDGSDGTNSALNIWVTHSDGSGTTPLTKLTAQLADSASPVWSASGLQIAYASSRALDGSNANNGTSGGLLQTSPVNIWVMNADGSSSTHLTKSTKFFPPVGLLEVDAVTNTVPRWHP